jgi:hypothetical protein
MDRLTTPASVLLLASMLCVLAACSKPAASSETHAASSSVSPKPGSACDRKVLTPDDVAGILSAPIIGSKNIPGDPQTCVFESASFPSITVSVRPGVGKATVDTWAAGNMPISASPLTGIGESAEWADELHELIAQQHNVLCDIQVSGIAKDLVSSTNALQRKLSSLCKIIFDAYG